MEVDQRKRSFFRCEKCGKKLIERLPNGCWRFVFGKAGELAFAPVEMKIHGSLVMRCLRRTCRKENPNYWNVLNFFPSHNRVTTEGISQPTESSDKSSTTLKLQQI